MKFSQKIRSMLVQQNYRPAKKRGVNPVSEMEKFLDEKIEGVLVKSGKKK